MKKIKEFFKIKYTKSKSKIYEISIICFMIDLFIKFLVKTKLTPLKEYEIIPIFFYICFVKNDGGAFSILRGKVWLLSLVGIIMLFFLDRYISNLKKIDNKTIDNHTANICYLERETNVKYLRLSAENNTMKHTKVYPILNNDFNGIISFDVE